MLKVRPHVLWLVVDKHLAGFTVPVELLAGPAGGATVPSLAAQRARTSLRAGLHDLRELTNDGLVPLDALQTLLSDLPGILHDVRMDIHDRVKTSGLP